MDLGTIAIKLTAKTADFVKSLKRAGDAIDKFNAAINVSAVKQFASAVAQMSRQIAETSPQAQKALEDLDKSWKQMLKNFAPAVNVGSTFLGKLLEVAEKLAENIRYIASAAGAYTGGMSFSDFERQYAQDVKERNAAASTIDFGGVAAAPGNELDDIVGLNKKKKKKEWSISLGGPEDVQIADPKLLAAIDKYDRERMASSAGYSGVKTRMLTGLEQQAPPEIGALYEGIQAFAGFLDKLGSLGAKVGTVVSNFGQSFVTTDKTTDILSDAMSSGADGFMSLITNSKAFTTLIGYASEIFGIVSDALGDVLMPIIEMLGKAIRSVALGILKVVRFILEAIEWIADRLGGGGVDKQLRTVNKAIDKLEDFGDVTDYAKRQVQEAFADVNVPHGVKVALTRYKNINTGNGGGIDTSTSSDLGSSPAFFDTSTSSDLGTSSVRPQTPILIDRLFIQANDTKEMQRELEREAARREYSERGTIGGSPSRMNPFGLWV